MSSKTLHQRLVYHPKSKLPANMAVCHLNPKCHNQNYLILNDAAQSNLLGPSPY